MEKFHRDLWARALMGLLVVVPQRMRIVSKVKNIQIDEFPSVHKNKVKSHIV
jgi:hypothetical protein